MFIVLKNGFVLYIFDAYLKFASTRFLYHHLIKAGYSESEINRYIDLRCGCFGV